VNALKTLLKPKQRDSIGYVSDPDRRAEDWTAAEIEAEFSRQLELGFPIGLYLEGNCPWLIRALDSAKEVKRPIVAQVNTGPPASFQGPFKPDAGLFRLASEGKAKLFFHLPYLFNLWLPFDASQAKWPGEEARVPLIRAYVEYLNAFVALIPEGLNIGMGFILHAGCPRWPGALGKSAGDYVPAMGSAGDEALEFGKRFRNNLAWLFDSFLGGLSRKGVQGRVLIENMAGADRHPLQLSSFKNCKALLGGFDKSRYGLCWDTLHSWAAGESLSPADFSSADVGLIHMNGGPANVCFGSRKDLHGYTELSAAVKRGTAYPWLGDAAFQNAPMVFERKLCSVMLKDSAWLAQKWGLA